MHTTAEQWARLQNRLGRLVPATASLQYACSQRQRGSCAAEQLLRCLRALQQMGLLSVDLRPLPASLDVTKWVGRHPRRPDYKEMRVLKARFPRVPLMALTATATPRVVHDVQTQLGVPHCLLFKSSFNRPNLR
jgi:bloom syndrome protein